MKYRNGTLRLSKRLEGSCAPGYRGLAEKNASQSSGITTQNPLIRAKITINPNYHQLSKSSMAIYQYYLAVVPQSGVLKQHGVKPDSIEVGSATKYFESNTEGYWKEVGVQGEGILPLMDKLLARTEWGNGKTTIFWKVYSEELDNDASLELEDEMLTVKEFSFRADLREKNLDFLMKMIALGKENQWMFMDRTGKLMNPDFEEIKESILGSKSFRFLKDPIAYLDSLIEQEK